MYRRILVPLENSPYDRAIVEHVRRLASLCRSSVVLVHVADGWVARNHHQLNLRESEEMQADRRYLEETAASLARDGLEVESILASGDPAREIVDVAGQEGCDLIAMSTHGHRFVGDVLYGSVANAVRHHSTLPVLVVRGSAGPEPGPH
ncbi:MAG TPA: universal stress protein [Longimicrobiaceae bacterium]|jgi:nucleotide-binding universal stress UspA family protein|nr:universal stress protein [Longimicrobiaceae bacterium]